MVLYVRVTATIGNPIPGNVVTATKEDESDAQRIIQTCAIPNNVLVGPLYVVKKTAPSSVEINHAHKVS